jgi:hypothetical protein
MKLRRIVLACTDALEDVEKKLYYDCLIVTICLETHALIPILSISKLQTLCIYLKTRNRTADGLAVAYVSTKQGLLRGFEAALKGASTTCMKLVVST